MSALGVLQTSYGATVFSGGSDGKIKVWRMPKLEAIQSIDLKGKLPLDLESALLPGSEGNSGRLSLWEKLTSLLRYWSLVSRIEIFASTSSMILRSVSELDWTRVDDSSSMPCRSKAMRTG